MKATKRGALYSDLAASWTKLVASLCLEKPGICSTKHNYRSHNADMSTAFQAISPPFLWALKSQPCHCGAASRICSRNCTLSCLGDDVALLASAALKSQFFWWSFAWYNPKAALYRSHPNPESTLFFLTFSPSSSTCPPCIDFSKRTLAKTEHPNSTYLVDCPRKAFLRALPKMLPHALIQKWVAFIGNVFADFFIYLVNSEKPSKHPKRASDAPSLQGYTAQQEEHNSWHICAIFDLESTAYRIQRKWLLSFGSIQLTSLSSMDLQLKWLNEICASWRRCGQTLRKVGVLRGHWGWRS